MIKFKNIKKFIKKITKTKSDRQKELLMKQFENNKILKIEDNKKWKK